MFKKLARLWTSAAPDWKRQQRGNASTETAIASFLENGDFCQWGDEEDRFVETIWALPCPGWIAFREGGAAGLVVSRRTIAGTDRIAARLILRENSSSVAGINFVQDISSEVSRGLVGKEVRVTFRYRCGEGFTAASGLIAAITASLGKDTPLRTAPPRRISENITGLTSTDWEERSVDLLIPPKKTQVHISFNWIPTETRLPEHWVEIADCRIELIDENPHFKTKSFGLSADRFTNKEKLVSTREIEKNLWASLSNGLARNAIQIEDFERLVDFIPEMYERLGNLLYRPALLSDSLNDLKAMTPTITAAVKKLPGVEAHSFFGPEIHSYMCSGLLYDIYSSGNVDRLDLYLYPANLYVLQFLLEAEQKPETLIDFACGIGNLFVYAKEIAPGIHYSGIDNFGQISEAEVREFQDMTSRVEISRVKSGQSAEWVSCIGLPFGVVEDEVLALSPQRVIVETYRYNFTPKLEIEFWNELVVVAKPVG